jgi:hypothetical protein
MQFDQLRRRQFITLLRGATAWPLAYRALALCLSIFFFAKSAPIFSGHILGMGNQDRSVMHSRVLA